MRLLAAPRHSHLETPPPPRLDGQLNRQDVVRHRQRCREHSAACAHSTSVPTNGTNHKYGCCRSCAEQLISLQQDAGAATLPSCHLEEAYLEFQGEREGWMEKLPLGVMDCGHPLQCALLVIIMPLYYYFVLSSSVDTRVLIEVVD